MKDNLNNTNISTDCGCGDVRCITEIEYVNSVVLPPAYVKFILQHNGASVLNDEFKFHNPYNCQENEAGFGFIRVEDIQETINAYMFDREKMDEWLNTSPDDPSYFYERIIPFGDNGIGDCICFDYRCYNTDNPPIIMWFHDVNNNYERIVHIADDFAKFVDMLYEPTDISDDAKKARKKARKENKEKEEKLRKKYINENNAKMRQLSAQYKQDNEIV